MNRIDCFRIAAGLTENMLSGRLRETKHNVFLRFDIKDINSRFIITSFRHSRHICPPQKVSHVLQLSRNGQ